jgi:hypothetical protein
VIWADEIPDEHYGVPGGEAAGHQQWGGQPHKVEKLYKELAIFRAKIA